MAEVYDAPSRPSVKWITTAQIYSGHDDQIAGTKLVGFEFASGTEVKGRTMDQQLQKWRSASSQRLWLSMLIDTMEEISRPERRTVPCDAKAVAALRTQLSLPASVRTPYASPYSLRN